MSYKVQGLSLAFPKAAAVTTGKFNVGDVVGLDTNSQIVTTGGLLKFPLSEPFEGDKEGSACVQMTGIAMVKIAVITGIDVGSELMQGANNGAILATVGSDWFGTALQKPTVANQIIPVLLTQGKNQT